MTDSIKTWPLQNQENFTLFLILNIQIIQIELVGIVHCTIRRTSYFILHQPCQVLLHRWRKKNRDVLLVVQLPILANYICIFKYYVHTKGVIRNYRGGGVNIISWESI